MNFLNLVLEPLRRTTKLGVAKYSAIIALAFGGGYMTRENSTVMVDKERVITNAQGFKTTIRDAIVWGDWNRAVDPQVLDSIWDTKPRFTAGLLIEYYNVAKDSHGVESARKQAKCLMLAKGYCESAYRPCIQRYEIGHHKKNYLWAKYTEFEATSGGLFQWMGFNFKSPALINEAKKLNSLPDSLKWGYLCENIDLQVDFFDKFMFECMKLASNTKQNGKDIIYKSISAYGGDPSSINALTDKNYAVFTQIFNKGGIQISRR